MKLPIVLFLCLAFATLGFLGGKLSSNSQVSKVSETPGRQPGTSPEGSRAADDDSSRSKIAGAKSGHRTTSSDGNKRLADSLRELLTTWNKPALILDNGDEREVLHTDLGELSEVMAAINRADAADLAELRELLMNTDETTEEGQMLNALLILPLTGRDIELRGAAILEETVEKAAVEEDDNFSEILPMMLYTLTRKNPAEAEAWLKTFQARPDVDDFTVDVDELKAVVEKGKIAR